MDDEKQVTAMEQWAMDTAAQLAPSLEGFDRVKIAIGLIQARATECLHYSGKFSVGNYLAAIAKDGARLGIPLEAAFALAFSDRHAGLERFAEQWAVRYLAEQEEKVIN
jgi:hypothetical protein